MQKIHSIHHVPIHTALLCSYTSEHTEFCFGNKKKNILCADLVVLEQYPLLPTHKPYIMLFNSMCSSYDIKFDHHQHHHFYNVCSQLRRDAWYTGLLNFIGK